MDVLETFYIVDDKKNLSKAEIVQDECPESPREWDNLGTLLFSHHKYELGDNNVGNLFEEMASQLGKSADDYESGDALIKEWSESKAAVVPVTLYDHSGICLQAAKLDGWDYSFCGFNYVDKDNKEFLDYAKDKTPEEAKEWAEGVLKGEIETLDTYVSGNVYCIGTSGFNKETMSYDDTQWCSGYYGDGTCEDIVRENVCSSTDQFISRAEAEKIETAVTEEFKKATGKLFIEEVVSALPEFDGNVGYASSAVTRSWIKANGQYEKKIEALHEWMKDNKCNSKEATIDFLNKRVKEVSPSKNAEKKKELKEKQIQGRER